MLQWIHVNPPPRFAHSCIRTSFCCADSLRSSCKSEAAWTQTIPIPQVATCAKPTLPRIKTMRYIPSHQILDSRSIEFHYILYIFYYIFYLSSHGMDSADDLISNERIPHTAHPPVVTPRGRKVSGCLSKQSLPQCLCVLGTQFWPIRWIQVNIGFILDSYWTQKMD